MNKVKQAKKEFAKLNRGETKLFRRLKSPQKIQDFINSLPINFEKSGETCFSPRLVLRKKRAHCLEGAIFAAAVLWFNGQKPLILDLKAANSDDNHVVAVFKRGAYFGAISKTNHAVLRYREPIYKSVRELAMSYFHEYFLDSGKKTLRSYSALLDLGRFPNAEWITSEKNLWFIDNALEKTRHYPILNTRQIKSLRLADKLEIKAGKMRQWPK